MLARLHRSLYRIRRVEEEIARVYPTDCIKSPVHLSIGQEAVSVGVCEALRPSDIVFGTYRGHALYLAKGGDLRAMIAELYGKVTGCARGKGGSMHLIATDAGMMGASAVVGTTIPNAVGYAYALKQRRAARRQPDVEHAPIVVSFFGDGATEEGVFSESLNFAVLKQLPILFVCENNQYAIHTHQRQRQGNPDICGRARSFGMPAARIEDNDVLAVHEHAKGVIEDIRLGRGPSFLEAMTYRWTEHVGPGQDFHLGYRTKEDAQRWRDDDQVARLAGMVDSAERARIETEVEEEIAEAFAFAEESEFPDASDLTAHVFQD